MLLLAFLTWPRSVLVGGLRLYKGLISPLLPPVCRFYPSCSQYATEAIEKHGVMRGAVFALARLARCHPLHPGGLDPIP